MKILWDMFFAFARIGGLTFGGGYAMLPMLQREVVERRGWATEEELADYYKGRFPGALKMLASYQDSVRRA